MARTPKLAPVHVRWLIRRDLTEAIEIDYQHSHLSWLEVDFIESMHKRNQIGMVAEQGEKIMGFMSYELHSDHLVLVKIAALPGTGAFPALMAKLVSKISVDRRPKLLCYVHADDLELQLRLRGAGMACIHQLDEDTYVFCWGAPEPVAEDFVTVELATEDEAAAG